MTGQATSANIAGFTLRRAGGLVALSLPLVFLIGCAKPASSGWAQNSAVIAPAPAPPKAPCDEMAAMP